MHPAACGDGRENKRQGEQTGSDVGERDGDPQPDIPHPWPYLKEAFRTVGSKNSSWLLLLMFIIFQSICLT